MSTRWEGTNAPRGDDYDARWRRLAAGGQNIHGEADLVEALLRESGGTRVLDAGCGTGRVAVELAARGFSVVSVDVDNGMLTTARVKNPELEWIAADLSEVGGHVDGEFDLVVLAGNVMIFLGPGSEGRVVRELVTARMEALFSDMRASFPRHAIVVHAGPLGPMFRSLLVSRLLCVDGHGV